MLVDFRPSEPPRRFQLWPLEGNLAGGRCYHGLSHPGRASPPPLVPPEVGGAARGPALDPSPEALRPPPPAPPAQVSPVPPPLPSRGRGAGGRAGWARGLGAAVPGTGVEGAVRMRAGVPA